MGFLHVNYVLKLFLVKTTWRYTWEHLLIKGLSNVDIEEIVTNIQPKPQSWSSTSFCTLEKGHLNMHRKETSNKCSQINYGRWFEDSFENTQWRKAKKCNQCEYTFSRTDNLKTHFKMHSGEKSDKCNFCDFASSRSCHFRTHLKNTLEKSQTNVTSVTLHTCRLTIWPDIWIDTVEESQKCNQCDYEQAHKAW